MGLSGIENKGRSCCRDHRAIGKCSQRPRDRMEAPAATLDPLVMQDAVDRFGGRAQPTFCGCPEISKPLGGLAPADKARAMARRKSDGLIEEEQLGPASASYDRSAATFVLTATDEPGLGGPAPVQQRLRRRIVDDATIADEHAPLGYGDNLAEGCDAVLKVHCRYQGRTMLERSDPSITHS